MNYMRIIDKFHEFSVFRGFSFEGKKNMRIGYARVSTEDQRLDLQMAALKKSGCETIYKDFGTSGRKMDRPGLRRAIKAAKPGQTLVVWRLDRLGRSLPDLIRLIEALGKKGVNFSSLNEAIDTNTSGGLLVFHIMAALAEFERSLISERTKAGLQAAQARGSRLGRPRITINPDALADAHHAIFVQGQSLDKVAARYGMSGRTLRRRLDSLFAP